MSGTSSREAVALKRSVVAADPRTRGQVMADTLVSRATGLSEPDQVPIELQLVITDKSLLAGGRTPADIPSYGPLPAGMARYLIAGLHPKTKLWLRRLYADPEDGHLVRMESKRRLFPKPQRCNQVKESTGWSSTPETDGTVVTTTPTGHRYSSLPPPRVGVPIEVDFWPAWAEAA
jgi:hypothetical protein